MMHPGVWLLLASTFGGEAGRLGELDVLGPNEPRAYFFRAAESVASNPRTTYQRWDSIFSRLMGIEGKALEEEIPGRSLRNIDVFSRFKQDHPRQLVLLHYNGNVRDPRDTSAPFFAGHWVYYNGARILEDIPAEEGESELRVDRPELFKTETGRYRRDNEDIGLCALDSRGHPDWTRSEQVQLVAIDAARGVIRVRRGCYGTTPRAFQANKSYAAAHLTEGPWGRKSHLLWDYNYATTCPRDSQGRQAADILANDLAQLFSESGSLARFDGIQFDVLAHWKTRGGPRGADVDADGVADGGLVDELNVYGIGVIQFLQQLRTKMGEDRLILADGHSDHHQRGFGILNGIESEGFPSLSDHRLRDWSGGLNRHAFWAVNGRAPVFSYINHKFVSHGESPGEMRQADVPFSAHRLVFAAALFTNSAICYSTVPKTDRDGMMGVWDELWAGQDRQLGWLGPALGPAVHLAERQKDLLEGRFGGGKEVVLGEEDGREEIRHEDLRQDAAGAGRHKELRQDAAGAGRHKELRIEVRDVPCTGADLVVAVTVTAEPMEGYPTTMPRVMHVSAGRGLDLSDGWGVETGMQLRAEAASPIDVETGARVSFSAGLTIGGQTIPGCAVHPPYRGGTGLVFWQREVELPSDATLVFHTGMGEKAPGRSDGVVFRVELAEIGQSPEQWQRVFEHRQVKSEWVRHAVSLKSYQGRQVLLRFVADAGPEDNATTDHGHWGNLRLVSGPAPPSFAAPQRFMSWCNSKPFTSYFYFDNMEGQSVDLTITIEGDRPATIHKMTANAAPEVVYRLYENGIVIANLGSTPVPISLLQLAPGRSFRRLRGTASQDPATNDGKPVDDRINVPARDAVFLIRN